MSNWFRAVPPLLLVLQGLASDSLQGSPPHRGTIVTVQTAPHPMSNEEAPLQLSDLLNAAVATHPDLAIARARAEEARGRLIQAGLYPNPTFIWEADEVGIPGNAAGTQGPIIGQTIVTAGKRRYARQAAAAGVAAADWLAMTRWHEVVTRVRLAYYDLLSALAETEVHCNVVRLAEEGHDAARKLQMAGTGTQPDVLRAAVELEQSRLRQHNSELRIDAAWKALAISVGMPHERPRSITGSLSASSPGYEWDPVVQTVLSRSSELQEAQSRVEQAERQVMHARAQRVPDLQVSARPFYSFPDRQMEVKIEAGAALPLFNRNQGNIAAAQADLERTRQEVRLVELRLMERLTQAFQRYGDASQQVEVYERKVIPNARESLKLIRRGYQSGDAKYDFTSVLQAQQTLAQAELAQVQARGNLWRAVAEIAGLLQDDSVDCLSVPNPHLAGSRPRCRIKAVRSSD